MRARAPRPRPRRRGSCASPAGAPTRAQEPRRPQRDARRCSTNLGHLRARPTLYVGDRGGRGKMGPSLKRRIWPQPASQGLAKLSGGAEPGGPAVSGVLDIRLRRVARSGWHRISSTSEVCEAASGEILGEPISDSHAPPPWTTSHGTSKGSAPCGAAAAHAGLSGVSLRLIQGLMRVQSWAHMGSI